MVAGRVGLVFGTAEDTGGHYFQGNIIVGSFGDGLLNITDGAAVITRNMDISLGENSRGGLVVSGTGTSLTIEKMMFIGHRGNGRLDISGGGVINSSYVNLGFAGKGVANVEGVGTEWRAARSLNVGSYSEGILNVRDGGLVSATDAFLGYDTVGTGIINIEGGASEMEIKNTMLIGRGGAGEINVLSGGSLSTKNLRAGEDNSGVAKIKISGSDSSLSVIEMFTFLGLGQTSVYIEDGGSLFTGGTRVFQNALSSGGGRGRPAAINRKNSKVVISGKDSLWFNDGDLAVYHTSAIDLKIDDEAVMEVGGAFTLTAKSSIKISLDSLIDVSGDMTLGGAFDIIYDNYDSLYENESIVLLLIGGDRTGGFKYMHEGKNYR